MLKGKKEIRLSQCMIVKNEEENLPRALGWAKDLAWEQIVVDTGSSDRTAGLAEEMGAKVFHYQWQDDFAAAKNYAIDQAKGDWIAFLDADEFLIPQGAERLKRLLLQIDGMDFDAVSTDWEQLDENGRIFSHGTQLRIFRRSPDIRYEGRVHEQLVSKSGRALRTADVGGQIAVFHTGYQKAEQARKGTARRNRGLLLRELEDKPGDSAILGYLGDTYCDEENPEQARRWYTLALRHMPQKLREPDQRSAVTLTRLLEIAARRKDEEELERIYEEGVSRLPKEPDFDYVMGLYRAGAEDFPEACRYLGNAFEKLNRYGASNQAHRLAAEGQEAAAVYVKCLYRSGDLEATIRQGEWILRERPQDMSVLSVYLQALSAREKDGTLKKLEKLYDLNNPGDRLFLYQCAFRSGLPELAAALWEGHLTEPEKTALAGRGMKPDRRM